MATEALDLPRRTLHIPVPASLAGWLRQWRRQHARRVQYRQVLAETSDPRLIKDAGFEPPAPGIIDLWARAFLQCRPHG